MMQQPAANTSEMGEGFKYVFGSFFTFPLLLPHSVSLNSLYQVKAACTSYRHKISVFSSCVHLTTVLIISKQLIVPGFSQYSFEDGKSSLLFFIDEEMKHRKRKGHIKSEFRTQEHGLTVPTTWLTAGV